MMKTRGWQSPGKRTNKIHEIKEAWLQGYFRDSQYAWDGKTWRRNLSELRNRDMAIMALGEVRHKKILDVGCGDGMYSYVFSMIGAEVSGQDIDPNRINQANQRDYGIMQKQKGKFVCADAIKLRFESNSFDCVFSADFFEHIDLNIKRKVLKEIYRILRPGGVLVIKTPNLNYLRLVINIKRVLRIISGKFDRIYIPHTNNNPDNEHHGLTTYEELRQELEALFFHRPIFHHQLIQRDRLPNKLADLLFTLRRVSLSPDIIISTQKSIFIGISDDLE